MPSLVVVELTRCEELQSVDLGSCSCLTHVHIGGECQKLERLELEGCAVLEHLCVRNCDQLRELNLTSCPQLRRVDASFCWDLEKMVLRGCREPGQPGMQWGDQLGALRGLRVRGCHKLQGLDLRGAAALATLDMDLCRQLKEVAGLGQLAALTQLGASQCPQLPAVHLGGLTALQQLATCWGLLPGLEQLQSLTHLELGNGGLQELPCLAALNALKQLHLHHCDTMQQLHLSGLSALQHLRISSCKQLRALDLGGAPGLKVLDILVCCGLREVAGLEGLPTLTRLYVKECSQLPCLDLGGLCALVELTVAACPHVLEMDLRGLTSLEDLSTSCGVLPGLEGLHSLTNLRFNPAVRQLTSVGVTACPLPPAVDLRGLTSLQQLVTCREVLLPGLEGLQSLTSLRFQEGSWQESLPSMTALTALKVLEVSMCADLQRLQLRVPPALEALRIYSCDKLQRLELQQGFGSLRHIDLISCEFLREVVGLEQLVALQSWSVSTGALEGSGNSLWPLMALFSPSP
jgi:Leucine-rich repeat (LRR) protein